MAPVSSLSVLYPVDRNAWRNWLEQHHATEREIWIQTYRKATGKPSISYDDLVEECLCFGWIDGVVKKYDEESTIQRITPRRKKTYLSELNRQRIWKLQRLGLMTPAGIVPVAHQIGTPADPFDIPAWILETLQSDADLWKNFQSFPPLYQRLRISWIAEVKGERRQPEAQKRLNYFVKMTRLGKQYGTVPEVW